MDFGLKIKRIDTDYEQQQEQRRQRKTVYHYRGILGHAKHKLYLVNDTHCNVYSFACVPMEDDSDISILLSQIYRGLTVQLRRFRNGDHVRMVLYINDLESNFNLSLLL